MTEAVKAALKIVPRRSNARGHANHGWLKSYHTFSFANYQDPNFDKFGALRVINEDRVTPGEGFGQHSHREFEIFSYIIEGELEHKDSLGNVEIMKPGEVQMTSTGTGVSHSEYNRHPSKGVHFLQIWALPHTSGLKPAYYNRHYTREQKLNQFVTVVAPFGREGVIDERDAKTGPAPVHSHLTMHASILESKQTVKHTLGEKTTRAYVHSIMKSGYRTPSQAASDKFEDGGAIIRLNGGTLIEEGDGAFITVQKDGARDIEITNVAEREAEFVFFEME